MCRLRDIPFACRSDIALVFSANPEDYTARGKIITPLKDRIGSEIRTHYPATVRRGASPSRPQESWDRSAMATKLHLPKYVQEVIEPHRLCRPRRQEDRQNAPA